MPLLLGSLLPAQMLGQLGLEPWRCILLCCLQPGCMVLGPPAATRALLPARLGIGTSHAVLTTLLLLLLLLM